jgi:hypothetical protein
MLRFPTGPAGIPVGFRPGLAGPADIPADITVESRGVWNGFTGPILEMMGFSDVGSSEEPWATFHAR